MLSVAAVSACGVSLLYLMSSCLQSRPQHCTCWCDLGQMQAMCLLPGHSLPGRKRASVATCKAHGVQHATPPTLQGSAEFGQEAYIVRDLLVQDLLPAAHGTLDDMLSLAGQLLLHLLLGAP